MRTRLGLALVSLVLLTGAAVAAAAAPASAVRWQPATYRSQGRSPVLVSRVLANGWPAYVALVDHTRTRLALYPGLRQPPLAAPRGPAEVPQGQRWRLLATFNGGFKANADAGGFLVNGRVDDPLHTGLGTLVEYRDGSLAILDWQGRTTPRTLVLARQNLPALVWNHRPNPTVASPYLWGTTIGHAVAVWRSAVGITDNGDLVYASAGGQTPASLAALMIRLGADRAVELDINPEWPSFITYRARGGRDPMPLVPNPQQSAYRYLAPDNRDFFAIYTRTGGGPFVPFR